ncbi:MAG: threonine dehydratase [Gammaproteobacteria bacterium]|jgi:threonine dehydratase
MIDFESIKQTSEMLRSEVVRTPLLNSPWVDKMTGGRIFFKAECLQRTGSFKIRGATNKIISLEPEVRQCGVVAYSSGNHAQGVAAAATSRQIKATIVMPHQAPEMKINNTRDLGANIVLYDRESESREEIAADIAKRQGFLVVPPYDDQIVITGQATVGYEILEQIEELAINPDSLLCPCGGGGLIAGVSSAIKARRSNMNIYSVEPDDFDDTRRSLEAGKRVANLAGVSSICDAIVTPTPGKITFEINRCLLSGGFRVSDESVRQAVLLSFDRLKLVVEPGAAVGLAALISGQFDATDKTVIVVLSGGNMDVKQFCEFRQQSLNQN